MSIVFKIRHNLLRYCHYRADRRSLDTVLASYREYVIWYESLSQGNQKDNLNSFLLQCNNYAEAFNSEIQQFMQEGFYLLLEKEEVQVHDVVAFILKKHDLSLEWQGDNSKFTVLEKMRMKRY